MEVLIGKNGSMVGSADYFQKLNQQSAKQLEEAGYISKTYVDNDVNFVIPTPMTTSVEELNQRAETAARAKRLEATFAQQRNPSAFLTKIFSYAMIIVSVEP